jgi:hypothetical protein
MVSLYENLAVSLYENLAVFLYENLVCCPANPLNKSGREDAGPSTPFGANSAPNSAQDDSFVL